MMVTVLAVVYKAATCRMDMAMSGLISTLDLNGWQTLLDGNPEIFHGLMPGARIGLLSKDDFEPPQATMLVWQVNVDGMQASYEPFPGFEQVLIDLLFIADEDVIRRLHSGHAPEPFAEIKAKVRRRDIILYVVKPRDELIACGYEDFLDSLGLAFMGACR